MKKVFQVKNEYINSRLDRWFRRNICEVPQSLIEKNIRKGKIKVNNIKQKSSYKLKENDQIAFKYTDNPNGSCHDIAGIFNKQKTILGMMPHPERASELILGSENGVKIFQSILSKL